MIRHIRCILLIFSFNLLAHDRNLVIIIDNLQQETSKTQEINMTHQCITVLQQRASLVLVSTNLWKNIVDRKKYFAKQLENNASLQSIIFDLYQTTNKQLKISRYNLAVINQKLSQAWFVSNYPQLLELSQEQLNQLRFDFLCYIFEFDMSQWHVYHAHEGMLLFIPRELNYQLDPVYEIFEERDLVKHSEKKSHPVASLQTLLHADSNRWIVYLTGHGHPKSAKQGANIAGLNIDEFKKILDYLDHELDTQLLLYSSCYGGGVHTVEPYENVTLHYPVIVTAATDAPIFGFGLFEGVKLPPYDNSFKLQPGDVLKNYGLLPVAMQNFPAFFKRAWKGQWDLNLVQLISRFFMCDLVLCHVQKIENFPLIRKARTKIFTPMRDGVMIKLVQQVTSSTSIVTGTKPLLVYTKKIKKLKLDRPWPIISMLPGIQSHQISELYAPQVSLSQLIAASFLSLEDMQAYKNFMIKKLLCWNDLIKDDKKSIDTVATFTDVLVLDQQNLMPKFFTGNADALIYVQLANKHYLIVWDEQKITELLLLDDEQIAQMSAIATFVQQSVNYDATQEPTKLLSFDGYAENKVYQQKLADECVKRKMCRR